MTSLSAEVISQYFEIVYNSLGWIVIDIGYWFNNPHAVDVCNWLEDNCEGNYKLSGAKVAFELSKDATMFSLRWL